MQRLEISSDRHNNNITVIPCWSLCVWLCSNWEGNIINASKWLRTSRTINRVICNTIIYFSIKSRCLRESRSCRISSSCYREEFITISKSISSKRVNNESSTTIIGKTSIGRTRCHRSTVDSICTDFDTYWTCGCSSTRKISESDSTRAWYSHIKRRKNSCCNDNTIDSTTGTWANECIIPVYWSWERATSDDGTSTDLRSRCEREWSNHRKDTYSCKEYTRRSHMEKGLEKSKVNLLCHIKIFLAIIIQ